jgi:capsular exopolysaccharide synthesis family protein
MTAITASGGLYGPNRQLQIHEPPGGPVGPLDGRSNFPMVLSQQGDGDDQTIDLRAYWSLLLRRRRLIGTMVAIAALLALIGSFVATPIYRASVLVQIDLETDKVVEFEGVTAGMGDPKDFYETQYELLKSRSLARRVIDQLGLRSSKTFAPAAGPSFVRDTIASVKSLLSSAPQGPAAEEEGLDLESLFLENLNVTPVKNSRLVLIEYDSPDPQEAAAVANAVAENYVNTTLERRYDASAYAKSFLEERILKVRQSLEESELKLVEYAKQRQIVDLDDRLALMMDTLKEMGRQQIVAESERMAAESEYQQLARGGTAGTVGLLESPVIQTLKERQAALSAEYQDKLKVFKPGYPKMQALQQQIAETERQIAAESANVGGAARATYEAKLQQEGKLAQRINEIKSEILSIQEGSTDYQSLKREVDTNRQLYDGLLQRIKEVGVVAGIGTNNISIVDAAEVPRDQHSPNLKKNLAIAIVLGLFLGIALAFMIETLDDSVKSTDEVERRIGAPVLSLIPWMGGHHSESEGSAMGLLAFRDPKSALAEAYRSLRTSLIFSTSEGAPRVLHFASSGPGEGKTTSACSTAITFAQTGSKVLLVDCDLRNPSLQKVFRLPNDEGLTNFLTGSATPAQIAKPTEVTRLFVITSGPLPPNPVELLSGARMLDLLQIAQERFDYVVLDGPPVIGLADALILANLSRATLFVIESSGTRAGALEGSIKRLRAANANILGAVFVKHGRAGEGAGYGYGYGYGYDYHYTYTYGNTGHRALTQEAPG